ncbi:MAG: hypothetical protein JNK11_07070 [Alphaproteobacteria bacterium]|nr:hypothetical protein [Alphaproteobacteria bacterium]
MRRAIALIAAMVALGACGTAGNDAGVDGPRGTPLSPGADAYIDRFLEYGKRVARASAPAEKLARSREMHATATWRTCFYADLDLPYDELPAEVKQRRSRAAHDSARSAELEKSKRFMAAKGNIESRQVAAGMQVIDSLHQEGFMMASFFGFSIHAYGYFVERDLQRALSYMEPHAATGCTFANGVLGHFARDGIAVQADRVEAYARFSLAREYGDDDAAREQRDIERGMPTAQIEQARARAAALSQQIAAARRSKQF